MAVDLRDIEELSAEERAGAEDLWRVNEANAERIAEAVLEAARRVPSLEALITEGGRHPEQENASNEMLRQAILGNWSAYAGYLQRVGRAFVSASLPFSDWYALSLAFQQTITTLLTAAYGSEPKRLAAALSAVRRLSAGTLVRVATAYIDAKDADLGRSEQRYHTIFDSNPLPMWIFDKATLAFLEVNETAIQHYGYTREEFGRMTIKDIRPPEDVPAVLQRLAEPPSGRDGKQWTHVTKDGRRLTVEVNSFAVDFHGREAKVVLVNDVTEHKKLEAQFRQSQKMEAVGRLAGGVAHDFNNLLSVVLTYSEMLLRDFREGDPLRADLLEIKKAGERAAALTRQLLAFSRQQVLAPKVVSLNDVIVGVERMLRRTIGEDIEFTVKPGAGLWNVLADTGQVEQVLMNLAVNARDAMAQGGGLLIETANVQIGEGFAKEHPGLEGGPHVMITVADSGCGMDPATLARIFEPFFTTKELGKGTGLGLATVFGIVKQSHGYIAVESAPGRGTTFRIYLPKATDDAKSEASPTLPTTQPRGVETILLVEDDDAMRRATKRVLKHLGYAVVDVRNGGEALLYCEQNKDQIDLLLTDVVMPGLSGPELAKRLERLRPGLKVLCMSGYPGTEAAAHGLGTDVPFLQKPVPSAALGAKVREVLGGR